MTTGGERVRPFMDLPAWIQTLAMAHLPLWLQAVLVAEGAAVGWLSWRFGWRGLAWSVFAAALVWLLLAFGASFLVSRLEGGGAPVLPDLLLGALMATLRLVGFGGRPI